MATKNTETKQVSNDVAENNSADNKKQSDNVKKGGFGNVLLWLLVLALCGVAGYGAYEVKQMKEDMQAMHNTYVYNMEAVLQQTGLADENRKFEANMADLEKEIDRSEKKVKSMKDEKLKQEYREMYMKSLTMKRDSLVENHEKFMKSLLKNINKALTEVAKNYDVKVIFSNKSVVFSTNYVTDITPIVAKNLKEKMDEE